MATLKATKRGEFGTQKARRLRSKGMVPAIIYGHGAETVAVTVNGHDVAAAVQHGSRLLEVDLEGRKENVLIKEIQYDTFGKVILHVDLTRVDLDERVEVTVPIVLRGKPVGAEQDGVLQQVLSEIEVECPVIAIPEEVRVPVNDLNVDDSLKAGQIQLPEGSRLLTDPDTLVCMVTIIAEEEEAPAEEAPAEPEVIGEKAEEGEEAEEEAEKPKPKEKEGD
jgi:large subunit ribosomal protein L25